MSPISIEIDQTKAHWSTSTVEGVLPALYVRGYGSRGGSVFRDIALLQFIQREIGGKGVDDGIARLREIIPELNGCWALVAHWPLAGGALAAVDRSRSIPLFFEQQDNGFVIMNSVRPGKARLIDDRAALEMLFSGYVSSGDTLYQGVKSIQPGELVVFEAGQAEPTFKRHSYFVYFPAHVDHSPVETLELELLTIIRRLPDRLRGVLKGRRPVVPLSSGFDSRLIVWMLREAGIKDVLCFTYGLEGIPAVELPKQVAKNAGYQWEFINYSRARWHDALSTQEAIEHWFYMSNGTSIPHIQDYAAVLELRDRGVLSGDSVFLPGHVGDAWATGMDVNSLRGQTPSPPPQQYHTPFAKIENDPALSHVVYHHFNLMPTQRYSWSSPPLSAVVKKVQMAMQGYPNPRGDLHWPAIEWILRTRTAQWIVNSVRTYELFGADFALPLADYEIIDFFRRLPAVFLLDPCLYNRVLEKRLFNSSSDGLFSVPIISGNTYRRGAKGDFIRLLQALHLYMPLERIRHRFRGERFLNSEHWFTRGNRSETLTLGDVLAPFEAERYLPESVYAFVRPWLKKPSYSISCLGILATALLARVYREALDL